MAEAVCYNCYQPGHISEFCPEEPQKSRCPSCKKVDKHTWDCKNPSYKSRSLAGSTTVFQLNNQLKIEFQNITGVFTVQDVEQNVEIGAIPLWLSAIDTFVAKFGLRSLCFATSRPMKRHITIMDRNNRPVLSLVFFQKILTINNRIELNDQGKVSFDCNARNSITGKIVCKIGVMNTTDVFKVRVTWFGQKHIFFVHPSVGPILVDPLQPPLTPTEPNQPAIENSRDRN